jgi:anti-sigma B factor antagonist
MRDADAAVVVSGDLDLLSAPVVRARLLEAINRGESEVVLEVGDIGFVDSVGVSVLLGASKRLVDEGRTLRLRGAPASLRTLLRMCDLEATLLDPAPAGRGADVSPEQGGGG